MLYAISQDVDARLRAKKVPLRVVFGPERAPSNTAERIVIEHAGDDRFEGFRLPQGNLGQGNPKPGFKRWQAAKATIYAQSSATGASKGEHFRRAEQVLDRLLLALDWVCKTRNTPVDGRRPSNTLEVTGGSFIVPKDLEGSEVWPGAVYELRFAIDRGIVDRAWDGETAGTAEIVAPNEAGLHLVPGTLQTA